MEPESQDEVEFYDAFGEDSSPLPSEEDDKDSLASFENSDSEDPMAEIVESSDMETGAPVPISFEENRANFKFNQLKDDKEPEERELILESNETNTEEQLVLDDSFEVESVVVEEMLFAVEAVEEALAKANAEGSIIINTKVSMIEEVLDDGDVIDRVETVIAEDSQESEISKVDSNMQIVEDQIEKLIIDGPFEAEAVEAFEADSSTENGPVDVEELIIDDPLEVTEERHDEPQVASQNESFEVFPAVHGESPNPPAEEGSLSPLGGMLASWGGALGSWGRSAKAQVDKLYSGADLKIDDDSFPTKPAEQNHGEKSFAKLFADIGSPKSEASGDEGSPKSLSASKSGGSGWIGTIDKTFDYASGAFGSVLFSGIKKLESTMGVAIEPLSPSASPKDSVSSPESTGLAEDRPISPTSPSDAQPLSEKINLTRNIYSTLEKLGKSTVNVVRSTKDRLMPLLEDDSILRQRVTMEDLKAANGWKCLFDQYSGNDAMEKLQVKISQASLQVKSKLKSLNPKQLSEKQTMLKPVGKDLLTFSTADHDDTDSEIRVDWDALEDLWRSTADVDFIDRLIKCLSEDAPDWDVKIAELEQQVESQFPVDRYLLFLYHARSLLARRLSSAHFLLLSITDYSSEDMILQLCHACSRSLHQIRTFVQKPIITSSLLEERKQIVLEKLIVAEVNEALAILTDAVHSLQPLLRLAKI